MNVVLINPATEEVLRECAVLDAASVEQRLQRAERAFVVWRQTDLPSRLEAVSRFEAALRASRTELAEAITREMGKVLKESLGEVDKCLASCHQLRENFPIWLAERQYALPSGHSVHLRPLGLILGIMPWNFPLWQVARFALPALLCGNTVLLKHAPNTWGVAEMIERLFNAAFPEGAYINLAIEVPWVERLIADPRVRGVSLTGSRQAGVSVARLAGQNLKKCVLELGGADAYVVLDDADMDLAADVCARSRLQNAGQTCIAAKRFIVTAKNAKAFTESLRARLAAMKVGDPADPSSQLGPLARRDLRDGLAKQVEQSMAQGSRREILAQGPSARGYYYPITLLTGVRPGQVAFDEELFGPVAAVIEAADEGQALALANQSRYGLGGALFSRDVEWARRLAIDEFESGMVWINDFVRAEVTVPFGGVKDSGLGRELGREGCFEITNVKTVFAKG